MWLAEYETLLVDYPAPHVVRVVLNRPDVLNALNTCMGQELGDLFSSAPARVQDDVRAIVLTGAGSRAFCAGADLKERLGLDESAWRAQHHVFERAIDAIAACPIPIVAAVNGVALGGGCELVLACDIAVASEEARFGQPEAARGIMPGLGGTQRLPRRIGVGRAKELLLTGRTIDAPLALAWGLVAGVVPSHALAEAALEIARAIAALAPIAVRSIKAAVDRGTDLPLDRALALERETYDRVVQTEDRLEGLRAFAGRRPPAFRNQ